MSLVTQIQALAQRLATEDKANKTLINGNAADLSALTTTTKTNLVAALNELKAAITAIVPGAAINDAAAAGTTTYSSNKINAAITAAISSLTNGAPAALDQLNELAAALGNDANYAATVTAALANRLRVDAVQTLTAPQKAQGQANLDVYSIAQIGDPATDFVATFNAGLA